MPSEHEETEQNPSEGVVGRVAGVYGGRDRDPIGHLWPDFKSPAKA